MYLPWLKVNSLTVLFINEPYVFYHRKIHDDNTKQLFCDDKNSECGDQ